MDVASLSPSELGRAVSDGFDRGEFSLVYQPLVAVDDSETVAFEALLRWHSPRFGEISPAQFIPAADTSGAIHRMGRWVLEESCRQLMQWREEFPFRNLCVSVNVSAEQVVADDFEQLVQEVLVLTGVDPRALQIEITQKVLDRDPMTVALRVAFLRELGIRVALDDLDPITVANHSLGRIGVDIIKIDRVFIDQLGRATTATDGEAGDVHEFGDVHRVLSELVAQARELGISVAAEGVEDRRQLEDLLAEQVDFAQGFFFAKPLRQAEVLDFLASDDSLPRDIQ